MNVKMNVKRKKENIDRNKKSQRNLLFGLVRLKT